MGPPTLVSSAKCFDGDQKVYRHMSEELNCEMLFSIYLPPQAENRKCPVLYWLSGLTCTEQNFITKSGFQRHAAKHGIIVVGPDTSPRGCNIEGEDDSFDFGSGAGFYVDATEEKWKKHYRMYSYVVKELPKLIDSSFPTNGKCSISGHSMGGHGAISIFLKNSEKYASVSAFAPISNPSKGPWGQKALTGYLGKDRNTWHNYDSTELVKNYVGPKTKILIDQGTSDPYLKEELLVENFTDACRDTNISPSLRLHKDYDHGYFFVSTFLEDHFVHHAEKLNE